MRTDLLRVVEAAYRIGGDEAEWLRAIAVEARGAVPGGPGVAAWTFRRHDAGPDAVRAASPPTSPPCP